MSKELFHRPGQSADPATGVITKVFSANYLRALYGKQGAYRHLVNFSADVSKEGESVTVPIMPKLSAVNVNMSTGTVDYNDTTVPPGTILINHHKAVQQKIPYNVFAQSKIDYRSAFAMSAGDAVADAIDAAVVAEIAALTKTAGSLGSDLDEDKLLAAMAALGADGVQFENPSDLVWILPWSQFGPTKKLKSYAALQITAGASGTEGSNDIAPNVDTLFRIPVFYRNDSDMTVSGGKLGGLFYRDSVGVAIQRTPAMEPEIRIPGTVNRELLCHALFGVETLKADLACKILCK